MRNRVILLLKKGKNLFKRCHVKNVEGLQYSTGITSYLTNEYKTKI